MTESEWIARRKVLQCLQAAAARAGEVASAVADSRTRSDARARLSELLGYPEQVADAVLDQRLEFFLEEQREGVAAALNDLGPQGPR